MKWDTGAQLGAGFVDVPGSSQLANFHLSTVVDQDLPVNWPAARASGGEQPSSCTLPRGRCHVAATEGEEFQVQGKATKTLFLPFLQHGKT